MDTPEQEKPGHGRKDSDDAIALALAAGCTRKIAARAGNVSDSTVDRRLKSSRFRRLVSRYRTRMIEAATGRVVDGMTAAADKLRQLVNHPDPNVALRAARSLLAEGRHLFSQTDLQGLIDKVETILKQHKEAQGHGKGTRSSN